MISKWLIFIFSVSLFIFSENEPNHKEAIAEPFFQQVSIRGRHDILEDNSIALAAVIKYNEKLLQVKQRVAGSKPVANRFLLSHC